MIKMEWKRHLYKKTQTRILVSCLPTGREAWDGLLIGIYFKL